MVDRRLVRLSGGVRAALFLAATHVGIYRATDDRSWPHDGDFDGQVIEIARPATADHLDLRAALDLKQPNRVSRANAIVNRRILKIDPRQIGSHARAPRDQLDAFFHERQHAQGEKIDFDEARVVAGILVPLTHDAILHRGSLERHQLDERPGRDDHPAGMLRDMARQTANLVRELAQLLPQRRVFPSFKARQVVHFIRQLVGAAVGELRHELDLAERQIECLADFTHRRSQPVCRERADESHMLGAVARVDAANQLLADLARKIEVDVRHRRECLVQESAEEEFVRDRIDVRQAEQVADDG